MSTYTQIFYHLVYSTKGRVPALFEDRREKLFHYHWGILKNNQCVLYRINAVDDHIHMLISLHPTIALANLIRDMKAASTTWMRGEMGFRDFPGCRWDMGRSRNRTRRKRRSFSTSRISRNITRRSVFGMN